MTDSNGTEHVEPDGGWGKPTGTPPPDWAAWREEQGHYVVQLRNGSEEVYGLVTVVLLSIRSAFAPATEEEMRAMEPTQLGDELRKATSLYDLVMMAQDPEYREQVSPDNIAFLKRFNLVEADGRMHGSTRNIVRSAFEIGAKGQMPVQNNPLLRRGDVPDRREDKSFEDPLMRMMRTTPSPVADPIPEVPGDQRPVAGEVFVGKASRGRVVVLPPSMNPSIFPHHDTVVYTNEKWPTEEHLQSHQPHTMRTAVFLDTFDRVEDDVIGTEQLREIASRFGDPNQWIHADKETEE